MEYPKELNPCWFHWGYGEVVLGEENSCIGPGSGSRPSGRDGPTKCCPLPQCQNSTLFSFGFHPTEWALYTSQSVQRSPPPPPPPKPPHLGRWAQASKRLRFHPDIAGVSKRGLMPPSVTRRRPPCASGTGRRGASTSAVLEYQLSGGCGEGCAGSIICWRYSADQLNTQTVLWEASWSGYVPCRPWGQRGSMEIC